MDFITIDQENCNQDGLCAAVCPGKLISFETGNFPEVTEDVEELCIRCGHCVAVCPKGCLQHKELSGADCVEIKDELLVNAAQVEQLLKGRRSIRTYKDKQVPKESLEKLLDIARYAPSGHNSQGVRWLVLSQRDELQRLSGIVAEWMAFMLDKMPEVALGMHMDRTLERWHQGVDVILRGAPTVVIAYAEKDNRMAATSCTIALNYLELAAIGMGLGGCWAGYFNAAAMTFPKMKEALNLPAGYRSFGAMMVGIPKYQYRRLPVRQPLDVTWRL